MNPDIFEYLQEATEVTDLIYSPVQQEDEDAASNASGVLKEMCSSGGDGRLTSNLLQKFVHFTHALARSTSPTLPYLTATCPIPIRRMVSLAAAIVAGPRALDFFVTQLAEFSRLPENPIKYGEEFLFTLALRSLVNPKHPSAHALPPDYFTRRENQMVYEEVIDYLLEQDPPAVAGVATLLEGLKEGAPQLFERLLEKSLPFLSPAEACEEGRHAEAVRVLRVTSGLSSRPYGYVASLRPCFATEDVGVAVAAMDSLTLVDCDIQGVTELQKLGLASPSDPEIRIAAYRGLVHCLPEQPGLLEVVTDALDPSHDVFSTQVGSYVWSHVQTVLNSDDPSQFALKDLLLGSEVIAGSRDPVWYDPRQHSRHLSHTVDIDSRSSLSFSFDLIWGRYSPAPRSVYVKVALHHVGETHDIGQVMVRVTALESMVLNLPGVKNLIDSAAHMARDLWDKASSFVKETFRTKREITHVQIAEFIDHVMSRIPAEYRSGASSIEVSLSLVGNHALHVRLSDLQNRSLLNDLGRALQEPIEATLLGLMPMIDNTFSMATLSGVPINLGVSGVLGSNSALMYMMAGDAGMIKFLASGGLGLKTQITTGRSRGQGQIWGQETRQTRPLALTSYDFWSLDLPFSASYERKGDDTTFTIRNAENWDGRFWQHRRETNIAGQDAIIRVTQSCVATGEPLEVCLDVPDMGDPGGGEGAEPLAGQELSEALPAGWLKPQSFSVYLKNGAPGEPVILSLSSPSSAGSWMRRAVIEVAGEKYEGSLVLQYNPTPSFALTANSPKHVYLLKGYAGSRESITQMAGIEAGYDSRIYGFRAQLSTPTLENQRVWSPSVFVSTPEGGEQEVMRSFFSTKDVRDSHTTELSFRTMGPLVEYLDFEVDVDGSWTLSQSDGSLRSIEIKKINLGYPEVFQIKSGGRVQFGHRTEGESYLTVVFDEEEEGVVELDFSVGPVVKFLGGPSPDLGEGDGEGGGGGGGGRGGSVYKFGIRIKHNQLPEEIQGRFSVLVDRGRVDTSLNFHLSETGGFNITHVTNGVLNYKTTANVRYVPLSILWGGEHEFMLREDEFKHFLKASWSPRSQDYASSLIHYVNHNLLALDRSLKIVVVYPGQVVEVENSMAEARGGSIKNKLEVRMDPGRAVSMETVIIYSNKPGMFSYGVSNSFKLDTWISPVNIVGTVNCMGSGNKCDIAVSAVQAADQLGDLDIKHTAAAGVSRSVAKFSVKKYIDGSISIDAVHKLGYYNLNWELALWTLRSLAVGHAEADVTSVEIATAEMILQELVGDEVGDVTSAFNATVSFNPEIRAVFSRQEVRVIDEGKQLLWVGVVQGRAGERWINSRHFGKATMLTPTGMYYSASGDIDSQINGLRASMADVSFSAEAGPEISYLLSWHFRLLQPNSTAVSSFADLETFNEEKAEAEGAHYREEYYDNYEETSENDYLLDEESLNEDFSQIGRPSLTLETLLRGNSPHTGEIKLKVKARKTDFYWEGDEAHGGGVPGGDSEKYDADIRLIRENDPEMGRIHGSLTRSAGIYSLNGRVWSGMRSFGVVSYGMARNDSLKSSHSVVLVDPSTPWTRVEVLVSADHLGSFPYNFQTSADGRVTLGFQEVAAVRALAQWTPAESAFNLGFHSFYKSYPGGHIYYKLSPGSLQASVGWREMKTVTLLQWMEDGRVFQFALNYDYPGAPFNDLDAIIKFGISRPPYPPVKLGMSGRVSVNGLFHYVMNMDCGSQQEECSITGALVKPGGSGSLRLQFKRAGNLYGVLGALVLDGFSLQVSGSLTQLNPGEEVQLNLHSSLLEEKSGYNFKITRKFEGPNNVECAFFLSQAGKEKNWLYTYRLFLEMERDIKAKIRRLRVEDHLTYEELEELLHDYNFLIMVVHNKFDELEVEIEFPDIWAEVKATGTVVKGKDSQLDLVFITPSIKHLLEGRLIFGSESWWSSHSGSFSYTQQGKKGRGQPFKLEVEGFKWNSDRQKYKLSIQKMVDEFTLAKYKNEENAYSKNDAGMLFVNFDASLDISRDSGSREYKMSWETDETKNSAKLAFEEDQSGGKGLFKYTRDIKGRPKSEIEYEVKANYRRFDTEVTLSATLDHTHIDRPRALSFLHSDAEGYTELVLDLFKDEGDQVILVITYLPENFRIRLGQFGNTFLQVGYQKSTEDEDVQHSVQLESSGHTLEIWIASSPDGVRTCRKGGLVLQTPSLAPTHNALIYCPAPSPELTIQVMGVEEHEGPYLRIGQISGPGGVGAQVGSGRLRPLDTPPALTLTTDVEEEVLEILIDWQSPSIAQLKEEVTSRGTSLMSAVEGLGDVEVHVEGSLDLWDLLRDTQNLLEDAGDLISSTGNYILDQILDENTEIRLGTMLRISGRGILEFLEGKLEYPLSLMEEWVDLLLEVTEESLEVVEEKVNEVLEEVVRFADDVTGTLTESARMVVGAIDDTVRPPLLRLQATISSLSYNDDQTLYAFVSRVMGDVRTRFGRQEGFRGFCYSNALTRFERWLISVARWEEIREKGSVLLYYLSQVTTFDAVMPHATALKLRTSTPPKLIEDLKAKSTRFKEERFPVVMQESWLWFDDQWARVRYLFTWHVYGEAVVFGWDQALTWDGRQVMPMLTDSCHHMLALLINGHTPTAVTIHLRDLETRPRKVFTFFSGTNRVTIDTNLRMTYNNQQIRRPYLEIGELIMTWEPGKAAVRSNTGLSLECEDRFDTCRLEVSWENFAATAGLLGVFDFDNNTDFMTSGWEMPATEEEWAQSWRVASMEECSSALPESDIFQHSEKECSMLFEEPESPFGSCFFSVPASPYLETCRTGWACGVEAAYVHVCQRHFHELQPNLTVCDNCNLKGAEEEGTEGLPREVVLITDFDCLEDIQDLVTALGKDQGSNLRITLRYIGRGTPPYGPFEGVTETVVDSATSPLDALYNAVHLDFSNRALKSVILFDCDHPMCTISMTAPKLLTLREDLLRQGIQLHVITQDPLLITDHSALSNKAKRQLIGVDARTTYTMSHARKRHVRGKRRLRQYVTTPMGNTCADMSIQSDGSVFSLHQLKIERKYHRKIYQQLLAARVRDGQNADYLSCRKCECYKPCTLCRSPAPFAYTSSSRDFEDDDEEEEDYEDEEEEAREKKKKKKKKNQRA
ncbi:uncharacterized protein [Macrobrachium rosenbergii]|uniref:uncharacterized protein isoform X2 n=1 Tax=Macrobrachium rosenbergii TaxID=79674 RepID=UPI0034D3E475